MSHRIRSSLFVGYCAQITNQFFSFVIERAVAFQGVYRSTEESRGMVFVIHSDEPTSLLSMRKEVMLNIVSGKKIQAPSQWEMGSEDWKSFRK